MLTKKFEILLAQTCTEKEFGKIDVTPSHCVITTYHKDRLTGEFTEHRERFVYGTSPTFDLMIKKLCERARRC